MAAYQGAAMARRSRSARQSKTALAQVLKSFLKTQNSSVTANGIRTAIGPLASRPSAIAACVRYSQPRLPVDRCSQAANIEAATSRLSKASAVAPRPMMDTPSEGPGTTAATIGFDLTTYVYASP